MQNGLQSNPCRTNYSKKLFIRGLITLFITGLSCLSASAQVEQELNKRIDLDLKEATLRESLTAIENRSKVLFNVQSALLSKFPAKINLTAKGIAIKEAISQILAHTNLRYRLLEGSVIIDEKPSPSPNVQAGGGPGTLKGRIVEFETSQPLPGATVYITDLQRGMQSNVDGYYTFANVPTGKYTLQVSFIGYTTQQVQVEVKAGKEETYDVKLQGNNSLKEVVVSGTRKSRAPVAHTTERQVLEEIKQSQSIVSGISSEQITKSADRNAAEVVKKISGVTIRDDKFIIVRGMNERYNLTYLNGNVAPSTELYSRAFSLDLIPSRIIDKILVYKDPAPDLLADMTGGAVKIFTKDAKNVKHFDLEFQLGDRPGTTFNSNFLTYQGGKWDFLGFDDGTRKLPSVVPGFGNFTKAGISQATYASAFSPILNYGTKTALPTMQLTANYYNSYKIGDHTLSSLTSLSYKNESQQLNINRTQRNLIDSVANPTKAGTVNVTQETQSNQTAQLSLLQDFTYSLKKGSSIYFRNFLLQQGQTSTILQNEQTLQHLVNGNWHDSESAGYNPELRNIILSYSQRFLYSGNLGGNHFLDNDKKQELNWNGGYTYSRLYIPDQRAIHLQNNTNEYQYPNVGAYEQNWIPVYRSEGGGDDNNNIDLGMVSRTWTQNTEIAYNGSLDYAYKLKPWVTFKAGTYQLWKQREVFRRVYTVNEGDVPASGYNYDPVGGTNPNMDFNLVFFHQQDLNNVWSPQYLRDDGTGLKVIDRTSGTDAYVATEQNNSGYAAISLLPFGGKLDLYGGLRVEYDRQKVAGALPPNSLRTSVGGINTPVLADIKSTTFLPSLNISYRPDSNYVLRGGYGKTVNRPEFRELSPYSELDYINNQTIQGNARLVSATASNYDLRFEWYPDANKKGETISLGGFYKDIHNPIERVVFKSNVNTGNGTSISYMNADEAKVKGLELDIQKDLDFIPLAIFRNISLIANGTYIVSNVRKVDTAHNDAAQYSNTNRQLQGQAPYSVNVGLYYENPGTGTKIAVMGNQVGPRIYAAAEGNAPKTTQAGFNPLYQGSLIELTRRQMDIAITQRIIKSLQAKFSIQNVLNDPVQIAEDANFTYKYEKATVVYTKPQQPGIQPIGKIAGDLLSSDYKPGRFFLLTLTYGF